METQNAVDSRGTWLTPDWPFRLVIALIFGCIGWLAYVTYLHPFFAPAPVTSTSDAGVAISASFSSGSSGGLFGNSTPDRTSIETDKAVYLVYGAFELEKGHRLTIKTHQDGLRELCDGERCAQMEGR